MQHTTEDKRCVQMPLSIDITDLPNEIKIGEVFYVNNVKYILAKVQKTVSFVNSEEKKEVLVLKQIL